MTHRVLTFIMLGAFWVLLSQCRKQPTDPQCVDGEGVRMEAIGGCGDVFLYGLLNDSTAVTISMDGDWYLQLEPGCHTYAVNNNGALTVELVQVVPHVDSIYFNYCNDIAFPNEGQHTRIPAVSGELTFKRTPDANRQGNPFQIDAELEDVLFTTPSGEVRFTKLVWKEVWVGWFPG